MINVECTHTHRFTLAHNYMNRSSKMH